MHWSGGKDSALCLHRLRQSGAYDEITLLTTVNQAFGRVSMHGVRTELLENQAAATGLPLVQLALPETVAMAEYGRKMLETLRALRDQGFTDSIFGDIFLEDLKRYREAQLAEAGMNGVFPLWQNKPEQLVREFIDAGFGAVLVCVNEKHLDASFAGRNLDNALLRDLPPDVDICGENGEYHSFVYAGPIFKKPIGFTFGQTVHRNHLPASDDSPGNCRQHTSANWDTGFFYRDLLPV